MDSLLPTALEVNPALIMAGVASAPRDGEQFLANVVLERQACQEVVFAPLLSIENKQNIFVKEPAKTISAPELLVPTLEWQNCQVADFSEVRSRISRIRKQRTIWNHPLKLPNMDCDNSSELWNSFFIDNDPDLSLTFKLKQTDIAYILNLLNDSLHKTSQGEGINPAYGKWIFALLAVLKLPLTPDMHNLLRELARKCSQIRARLSQDDNEISRKAAPLNLFICIIARYFQQCDLAD